MSYQSGPFGPGYTQQGGGPPGTGGPWGPPPGGPGGFGGPPGGGFGAPPGYPPPPPPKKSNAGLIIGLVVAVVFVIPMCAGIIFALVGRSAAKSSGDSGYDAPAQPAQPVQPAQPAQPVAPAPAAPAANGPAPSPAGHRLVRGIGFSYSVPTSWQDLNPADLGSPFIESAQRNPVAVGNFMTNANIAGEAFSGDGPAYGAANLIELKKAATIRDQRLTTSGSRAAWDIESYWTNPGGVPYVTLQRYVTNGHKGYVITCSGGAAVFAAQKPACEVILSTFRVD